MMFLLTTMVQMLSLACLTVSGYGNAIFDIPHCIQIHYIMLSVLDFMGNSAGKWMVPTNKWLDSWQQRGEWLINSLRPRQNGRHFADDSFKCSCNFPCQLLQQDREIICHHISDIISLFKLSVAPYLCLMQNRRHYGVLAMELINVYFALTYLSHWYIVS